MPLTKNTTLVFTQIPPDHSVPVTGVHLKVVDEQIDLDNVPLNGGVLIKTLVLSSDPYILYRFREPSVPMFCPPVQLGDPVDNGGVGKVLRSEDPAFKPGDVVLGYLNFAEYSVYPGTQKHEFKLPLRKIEKPPGVPYSAFLGVLGMPGHTAYTSFKAFIAERAKTAKTMFVSTAAGPVGAFVVEYTKIVAPHIKIIGSAGSEEKVEIMKKIGVDVPFNYKTKDVNEVLKEHGPLDIYYDLVGGSTLDAALLNFNNNGLIVAGGCISSAGGTSSVKHFEEVFQRSLTVRGFITYSYDVAPHMATFFEDVVPLVAQGKITSREHKYNGIEQAAQALIENHTGGNVGKSLIVVAED